MTQNVEVVVKVLNGCSPPFNHYWVFASGLTNVAVELTVTDTQTGEVVTYLNCNSLPSNRSKIPRLSTPALGGALKRQAVNVVDSSGWLVYFGGGVNADYLAL